MSRAVVAALLALTALAITGGFSGGANPPAAEAERPRVQVERPEPPQRIRAALDVAYGPRPAQALDLYRPAAVERPAAGVMLVHGGAWRHGSKRRMRGIAKELARAGFAVFNLDYTLASGEQPGLRRQPRDLRVALGWIRRHAYRLDVDPARIGALGSSAGGNLVALLATREARAPIKAAVVWSAPLDLAAFPDGWLSGAVETFIGCHGACAARRAAASPVNHVSPDDPPMLIVNSSREGVPPSQARAMAERLRTAGVPHRLRVIDGNRHGIEYAAEMLRPSFAFLKRVLRPAGR